MNKKKALLLSLLSGVLLGISWFPPLTFLIFIAWVPLLFLAEEILKNEKRRGALAFFFSYISFLIWNAIVTWWTWFASPGGCIAAILANALLMSTAYWLFFLLYKKITKHYPLTTNHYSPAVWLLIPVWLSFEYLHTLWELAWTWLTLGNIFSFTHNWVQWYEFTGVSGGSLWILAANILIFRILQFRVPAHITFWTKYRIYLSGLVIFLPIILSRLILLTTETPLTENNGQKIVVVQPNIDPYNDKFNGDYTAQLQEALRLAKQKLDGKTNYLVLPETFFTEQVWESNLELPYSVKFLRDSILKKYPNLIIITGASTYYQYKHGEKLSPVAHKYIDADEYYDLFITGLQLDNFGPMQVYHKSKLVPMVERMPYPAVFGFLEQWTIDLGGSAGSLGTQEKRGVFYNKDKTVGVAPVICYESVFGEYVTDYINEGANLVFIITNDGWWHDTPGYVQHLNYARLRAIEIRTPIARCANTGISCFIDETGKLSQETKWWEPAVISGNLQPNNEKTFYVKCGDLLSKAALVITLISVIVALLAKRRSTVS